MRTHVSATTRMHVIIQYANIATPGKCFGNTISLAISKMGVILILKTFLNEKERILNVAWDYRNTFRKFGMENLLDRARAIHARDVANLASLDEGLKYGELLVEAITGLIQFGWDIVGWFKTEQNETRAQQIITWLANSGRSVQNYIECFAGNEIQKCYKGGDKHG